MLRQKFHSSFQYHYITKVYIGEIPIKGYDQNLSVGQAIVTILDFGDEALGFLEGGMKAL